MAKDSGSPNDDRADSTDAQVQPAAGNAPAIPLPIPGNEVKAGAPSNALDVPPAPLPTLDNDDDDDNTIEKEWVTRAQRLARQTRNDPFLQSEELTKLKSEYLQKRYNKTIKLDDKAGD